MELPTMVRVRQRQESRALAEPEVELQRSLDDAGVWESLAPGATVAIAVGSRGINRIAETVRTIVSSARAEGASPVIVPAMGAHGGATSRGQAFVLHSLGITEESCGAPVNASMETVKLGETSGGVAVFMARPAAEADMVVAVNRVALHTGYSGPIQSGLRKMLAVGLGKTDGALSLHAHGFEAGHLIGEMADVEIEEAPVGFGVALVEDATRKLAAVEVIRAGDISAREPALLDLARSMLPAIPVSNAHVLIVEEIGKDISGVGMDPHVTGRGKDFKPGEEPGFSAQQIVVLRLSKASLGNATGIGHADVTTERFVSSIDVEVTDRNVSTSGQFQRARIPRVARSDRDAIIHALDAAGCRAADEAMVVRIRNTAKLDEMWVSSALAGELEGEEALVFEEEAPMSFDASGDLPR